MKHALPAALVILAFVPFALDSQFLVNLAMLTAVSAALGQAWNIAGGFGGLTSFGHAAFFGFGAYGAAILQTRYGLNPWLGLPLGALLGAAVGAVVGWASFRAGLRGSYFALATLAIAEAFRILANSIDFTRAGLGILVPLRIDPANFQFADRRASYALALALVALSVAVASWMTRSRFGAQLVAVRENEDAARALGVKVLRTKVLALSISGSITALGGVLYTQTYLYIDPNIAFGLDRSVDMLLVAMIGAIVLTLRDKGDSRRQNIGVQVNRRVVDTLELVDVVRGAGVNAIDIRRPKLSDPEPEPSDAHPGHH